MKFFKEFRDFISKGNVLDMAIGVVIGSAFTAIVTSLSKDIITPAISLITGKFDISKLGFVVSENLTISYGLFLQAIVNFLITAFALFVIIKIITFAKKRMESLSKKEVEEIIEETPAPSAEEILLTEIRDLLKEKN